MISQLKTIWQSLTEPHAALQTLESRRRARLTASLLLPCLLAFIVTLVIGRPQSVSVPAIIDVMTTFVLLALYLVSRSRYFGLSSLVLIVIIVGVSAAIAQYEIGNEEYEIAPALFMWLSISLILSYLMFDLRFVIGLAALHLIAIGALSLTGARSHFEALVWQFLVLTILVLVAAYARKRDQVQIAEQTRQLEEHKTQYQIISEMMSDYAYLAHLGPNNHVHMEWIIGQDTIFGYTADELAHHMLEYIHPEDRDAVQAKVEALRSGQKIEHNFRVTARDGSLRWVYTQAQPILDETSGDSLEVYGIIKDVTQHRQTENQLAQIERQHQAFFENAVFGMYRAIYDGDIILREANPAFARILGFSSWEEAKATKKQGQYFYIEPERSALFQTLLRRDGKVTNFESQMRRANGEPAWVSEHAWLVYDSNGEVIGYEGVMEDVTLRKQAEKQHIEMALAEDRIQVMQRFVRGATHDLMTPVTTMKTSLYLLRQQYHSQITPGHLQRLDKLEDQVAHIEDATNSLLKMSELDPASLQLEPVDLNKIVAQAVDAQQPVANVKQIGLVFEPGGDIHAVRLDTEEFGFAIRHLLANAIAHSAAATTITIQTTTAINEAVVIVKDRGEGIMPDDLPNIFEPFYRDFARQTGKGGVGLGLTIVKWIVEAHGGHIEVDSTPGRGSTFCVYLPLAVEPATWPR